jgi:uncharacterized protein (DUF302 family)
MSEYGYSVEVAAGYDETVIRTRVALRSEGFSILTEMHVGGMLGAAAGEGRQYLIMGAWTPATVARRLDSELQVGIHLPCNFVIADHNGGCLLAALDPADEVDDGGTITPELAEQARHALGRVLQRVSTGQP